MVLTIPHNRVDTRLIPGNRTFASSCQTQNLQHLIQWPLTTIFGVVVQVRPDVWMTPYIDRGTPGRFALITKTAQVTLVTFSAWVATGVATFGEFITLLLLLLLARPQNNLKKNM